MIFDLFNLSVGSLKNRKLRSWLTMIGIFIGITAVVALIGLGEGLRIAITSQFGFLGTDVLSVQASGLAFAGPPGSGSIDPLDKGLVDKIKNVQGVDSVFGRRIETARIEFKDSYFIFYSISVPSGGSRKDFEKILNIDTAEGRLLRDGDGKRVLLGYDYLKTDSNKDGVNVGDTIVINDIKFEVVGILDKKGSFIFDSGLYINEDTMDDVFGSQDTTDVIAIRVKDVNQIATVKEDVEKLLRKERDVKKGEENFVVDTPQNALESLNSTLFAVQLFVYIIATISLVVGGIGIMNTMYTSVLERSREIGIMKAIGARNSDILKLFLIESGLLGLVGGIIGATLGYLLAKGMAFAGKTLLGSELIQASISPLLIIGALMFSFILGTVFGVLPAIQASKLQPVNALRK
ncbi:MAG: ABC transporter permease [Nanoarchaeota archaeon]|nr:ABC transporter permease [Nanoarchaeota archaeon]